MRQKLIRVATIPESLLIMLKNQLKFLNEHFDVIGIASPGEALDMVKENEKIKVIPLKMYRGINIWGDIISLIIMYKILRNEKPFIIHSVTPKAGLISMMAGYFAGVPHRIHTFTGLIFPSKKGFFRFVLLNIDRLICSMATIIIPEGEGVKNELIKYKASSKRLKVLANGSVCGIDLIYFTDKYSIREKLRQRKILGIHENDIVFIFIGRIVVDKGIEELVTAFTELGTEMKNIKLILVGPYEKHLDHISNQTEKLISKNVNIISIGLQKDVRPYLAISNILVLPSYREGFPNAVMQAGAMNLPCIVTDINGSNEIILHEVNGLIIPSKNKPKLIAAMKRLILNKDERKKMSECSRQMIVQRYDQNLVWTELLKLYNSLN